MRIKFSKSFAHFRSDLHPTHGPQVWPWWRLVSFSVVRLEIHLPSTGYRLWVYTRWGACFFDVYFDRRNLGT